MDHAEALEKLTALAKSAYDLEFSAKPLQKNVVMIIGDQSSGKSSLINYFFGDIYVRETGQHAIDTQFTIIESLPELDFRALVGVQEYKRLRKLHKDKDASWLSEQKNRDDDDRRNTVWRELTFKEKKERYGQLYGGTMGQILSQHDTLFKAIVVNEACISGTELERRKENTKPVEAKPKKEKKLISESLIESMDGSVIIERGKGISLHMVEDYLNITTHTCDVNRHICKDMIFIDTPGFNGAMVKEIEKFKANIQILDFFYRQASLALVLLSPTNLLSVNDTMMMVQLTLLDEQTRNKILDDLNPKKIEQVQPAPATNEALLTNIAIGTVRALVPGGSILGALWSAKGEITRYVSSMFERAETDVEESQYEHSTSSVFEKLYFVINKADLIQKREAAFFELGYAMGQNMKHLPVYPSNKVLMVGCPGEQRRGKNMPNESLKNLQIGDMQQLEAIINNLRNDDYVDRCYRQHMRYIYEKMKEKDKTKGYTAMVLQLYRSPLDEARKLCGFGL